MIGSVARLRLQLRQAEVENLHAPVAGDEEVLWLEVAMDDAFGVRRRQTAGDLLRVIKRLAHGQRTVIQLRAQLLAFQQLGDDVGRALVACRCRRWSGCSDG